MADQTKRDTDATPENDKGAPSDNTGGVAMSDQETRTLKAMTEHLQHNSCLDEIDAGLYCEGLIDGYELARARDYISASVGHGPSPITEKQGMMIVDAALAKVHARYADQVADEDEDT